MLLVDGMITLLHWMRVQIAQQLLAMSNRVVYQDPLQDLISLIVLLEAVVETERTEIACHTIQVQGSLWAVYLQSKVEGGVSGLAQWVNAAEEVVRITPDAR